MKVETSQPIKEYLLDRTSDITPVDEVTKDKIVEERKKKLRQKSRENIRHVQ